MFRLFGLSRFSGILVGLLVCRLSRSGLRYLWNGRFILWLIGGLRSRRGSGLFICLVLIALLLVIGRLRILSGVRGFRFRGGSRLLGCLFRRDDCRLKILLVISRLGIIIIVKVLFLRFLGVSLFIVSRVAVLIPLRHLEVDVRDLIELRLITAKRHTSEVDPGALGELRESGRLLLYFLNHGVHVIELRGHIAEDCRAELHGVDAVHSVIHFAHQVGHLELKTLERADSL